MGTSGVALQATFLTVGWVCFFVQLGFLNKNATRCNLKPYDKFWPEPGV